ncbi:MAG: putative hydrolase of the superfamily [Candidatus Woesearchaeota archaeon]|nr:putative hydrolase of the superfamily [Candidatus Woesearchaeota archaeon]MDN5327540.1 putative hydrolase of the superfamily [Candidatus Woesearchaeota archaeon]
MNKIKVIYFDLDDTLIPTSKIFKYCVKKSNLAVAKCIKKHYKAYKKKSVRSIFKEVTDIRNKIIKEKGSNYKFQVDETLKRMHISYDPQIISAGVLAYHKATFEVLQFNKEVFKFLEQISKRFRIGILSSGLTLKQWDKIHNFLGITQPFFTKKNVIISEEFGIEGKNETLFKEILKREKVKANEVLYVGDRYDHDILPAKHLGFRTVLVNNPSSKYFIKKSELKKLKIKPDLILKEVTQINPKILEKI